MGAPVSAGAPFDWSGVVVGHWRVERPAGRAKWGGALWRCVSYCGVASVFRAPVLAAGATLTCEGCRRGAGAPGCRVVVAEGSLAPWRANWSTVVEEKSNLKGRNATADWDAYGRPALLGAIDRTGLGRDFGWKCFVRDCHEMNKSGYSPFVRVKSVTEGQRRVELSVRPAGGAYTFEVDVSTGRTDVPFADVRRALEAACAPPAAPTNGKHHPAPSTNGTNHPPEPAPAPAPAPAPTVRETILGGLDVEKLLRLRSGFDTLITVGREATTAAELKAEAQSRLAADPALARAEAAAAVAARALAEHECAAERVRHLADELRAATDRRDKLAAELSASIAARDAALRDYSPLKEAAEAAAQSVAEAEGLEAERLQALGKADDLLPLLAALQKLGA